MLEPSGKPVNEASSRGNMERISHLTNFVGEDRAKILLTVQNVKVIAMYNSSAAMKVA